MPPALFALIPLTGLLAWLYPLLEQRRRNRSNAAQTVDRRARWGMLLEMLGYSLLWQADFWSRPPEAWRVGLSIAMIALAIAVSFQAARALGRHMRIEAGLNADHRLVREGPYRFVRHPVYSSFLCLTVGTGVMLAPWVLLAVATVVFVGGTEIRVHVEDGLLAARFGDEFVEFRKSAKAYIPFIR